MFEPKNQRLIVDLFSSAAAINLPKMETVQMHDLWVFLNKTLEGDGHTGFFLFVTFSNFYFQKHQHDC